jgi:Mg-chelatase subunit ChlD
MGVLLAAFMVNGPSLADEPARAADSAESLPKDVVLLLDNSGSMQDSDPLALTKVAFGQMLNEASSNTRFGLVIFDKNATLVSGLMPVTEENRAVIASGLSRLSYNGTHTNIPAALAAGVAELGANGLDSAFKSVVLVTDGIIDTGDKKRDRQGRHQARNAIVADARARGIRINTIALGNKTDAELLREFAARTGGQAYSAARAEDLPKIFQELHQDLVKIAALPSAKAGNPSGSVSNASSVPNREQAVATSIAPAETVAPAVRESDEGSSETDGSGSGGTEGNLLYRLGKGILFVGLSLLAAVFAWIAFRAFTQARDTPRPASAREARLAADMSMPAAYLEDLSGTTGRQYHELSKAVTVIGRAPGQQSGQISIIVIPNPAIGRRHAVIEYQHHGFWLIDQNSKNGTFLNGKLITQPACLSHGDRLSFYNLEFGLTFAGMNLADDTLATDDLKLLRTTQAASSPAAAESPVIPQDRADTMILKRPLVRAEPGSDLMESEQPKDLGRDAGDDDTHHRLSPKATRNS